MTTAIPRVLHRIWLGPRPMPAIFNYYGEKWRALHPGWEIILWTDDCLPPIRNADVFWSSTDHGARSDILRYELLWRFGGVYVDMDFEPLRPLDPLLQNVRAFTARAEPTWIGNAVLAAEPNHELYAEILAALPGWTDAHASNWANTRTGPALFQHVIEDGWTRGLFRPPDLVVHPPELFYPYHYSERWRKGEAFPQAYAVHHWAGSWIDRTPWESRRLAMKRAIERTPVGRAVLRSRPVQGAIRLERSARRARHRT